ncbi:hypothetical protein BGZ57DRAFT_861168 [Hyaloscypha finlandica]|nr:hypothetical protein BGZ57DRAFT_861168 [Hyaloscypha finlandica]KAH8755231.1 hypothetical protein F5882DRAFT_385347 [Hyaloscypha sp. PMI_1271]
MTYSLAVKKFDSLRNLQTKTSQVIARICRGTKQAERQFWAKNRIHKGEAVPIRPMNLEVVQWEANELHAIAFVCMLAVSTFVLVHLELGAVVTGCLGHQNL